jgi:hypothetical protein
LSKEDFEKLTNIICQCFPGEDPKIYFLPQNRTYTGKLYVQYAQLRNIFLKRGLATAKTIRMKKIIENSTDLDGKLSFIFYTLININKTFFSENMDTNDSLSHNHEIFENNEYNFDIDDNWDLTLEKWKHTEVLRNAMFNEIESFENLCIKLRVLQDTRSINLVRKTKTYKNAACNDLNLTTKIILH